MKRLKPENFMNKWIGVIVCLLVVGNCHAQHPIIQTIYTADPAPLVHEGMLYLYTGHDEDDAPESRFVMHDYQCFTTKDMVNWTFAGYSTGPAAMPTQHNVSTATANSTIMSALPTQRGPAALLWEWLSQTLLSGRSRMRLARRS